MTSRIKARNWEQQIGVQLTAVFAALIFGYESTNALSGDERAAWLLSAAGFGALVLRLIPPTVEIQDSTVIVRTLLRTRRLGLDVVRRFSIVEPTTSPWRICQLEYVDGRTVALLMLSSPSTLFRRKNRVLDRTVSRLNAELGVTDTAGPQVASGSTTGASWLTLLGPAALGMVVATMPLAMPWKIGVIFFLGITTFAWLRKSHR